MNTTAITVAMVMAAGAGTSAFGARNQNPTLTAYMIDARSDHRHCLFGAEALASRMFASAGFDLKWRGDTPAHPPAVSDMAFIVTVVDQTPADLKPGALAFAQVFEGVHLTIYYDRVPAFGSSGDAVLAHVLVHELTHLIQGIDRHSESGVMKAHYTYADMVHMATRLLPFTDDDVFFINLGVAHRLRSAALVANTSAPAGGHLRDVNR